MFPSPHRRRPEPDRPGPPEVGAPLPPSPSHQRDEPWPGPKRA